MQIEPLLVALDVESGARALQLADDLRGIVGGFKIGSRLFTAEGPAIVQSLAARGDPVFLDLKFHDIPHTVGTAVAAATSLGVWMINVHASGGMRMMQAARDAAHETAAKEGRPVPLVIAVTVLTSLNATALAQIGIATPILEHVVALAELTQTAGLDGVVASAQETASIRQRCGPEFVIVTPGIRGRAVEGPLKPHTTPATDDQERTMEAREAVAAGASYIVVGRPIIAATDPRAAAATIARDLRSPRATSP